MHLVKFCILCMISFGCLQFLLNWQEKQYQVATTYDVWIPRYARCLLLAFLRSAVLVLLLTCFSVLLIWLFLQQQTGITADEASQAAHAADLWRGHLIGFGSSWGRVILSFLLLAGSIYFFRHRKTQLFKVIELEKAHQRQRLTEQLRDLQRPSNMTEAAYQHYKAEYIEDAVNNHAKQLRQKLDAQSAQPESWFDRLQIFFLSWGLFRGLSKVQRLVYWLCLALLVPAYLGTFEGHMKASIDHRYIQLLELRLLRNKNEWGQFQQQIQANNPAKPPIKHPITEADQRLIQSVVRIYESALLHE